MSLNIDLNHQDKQLCDEFENKIIQTYDGYLNIRKKKLEQIGIQLKEINILFENNSYLGKFSLSLMKLISELNKKWLSFYPTFSFTYKSRKFVTPNENVELIKLRNSYDKIFPFISELNLITGNTTYSSNFETFFNNVDNKYKTTKSLLNELIDKMTFFENLLVLNKNITFGKNSKSYTQDNNIDEEEMTAFQNEYIFFEKSLKSFIDFVLKEVKISYTKCMTIKKKLNAKIDEIQDKNAKISTYKFEFVKNILKIIK